MPRLRVVGPKMALDLSFDRAITIGRHISNSLPLPDTEASRKHAQIFPRDGRFRISDLESRNGVFVNGRRADEQELQIGDEIAIGTTLLFFEPPGDVALSDMFSRRGAVVYEQLPPPEKFPATEVTTFSPVELDALVEEWIEGAEGALILPSRMRAEFLGFALSLDRHTTTEDACASALLWLREKLGGSRRLLVMSANDDRTGLKLHAGVGLLEKDEESSRAGYYVPKDITRIVHRSEKAIYCPDVNTDYRFTALAEDPENLIASFLAVPLYRAGKYAGFLYADREEGGGSYTFRHILQAHLTAKLLAKSLHWFHAGRASAARRRNNRRPSSEDTAH